MGFVFRMHSDRCSSATLYFIVHAFLPPSHHLFTTHAHTIAACFAVVPMSCHLFLISLATPYLEVGLLRHTSM